jgi:hypothetical protein
VLLLLVLLFWSPVCDRVPGGMPPSVPAAAAAADVPGVSRHALLLLLLLLLLYWSPEDEYVLLLLLLYWSPVCDTVSGGTSQGIRPT